jgi:DNA-binding NarL/FixJ family response regulator
MQEIRIAIVEDNRGLREGLEEMIRLAPGMTCVRAFSNAEDAIRSLAKCSPDVVLMDIHLPFRSGIECTRRVKDQMPELQVLILTVYEDNESIFDALKAGASGYLLKRSSPAEIIAAIRDIHVGGAPMSSQIARKLVTSFQAPGPSLESGGEPLSEREEEVLGLITKGYAGKEIADKMHVSINTVKTHLRHIYRKLHVRSRTEILLRFHSSQPGD